MVKQYEENDRARERAENATKERQAAEQSKAAPVNGFQMPKSLADVTPRQREFLWYPYIPLSEYTVLFAESGICKSWICLAIAAAISKGEPLPGETESKQPCDTLFISSEDDADDLKERIKESGADFSRIHYYDRTSSLGLAGKIELMRQAILATKAKFVILDPWQAFIGSNIDTSKQNQMREALQKISVLAKQTECAIVLISHVNKRERRESINNAPTGSSELINACRSALTVVYENKFSEETINNRLIVQTKSSHAAPGRAIRVDLTGGRFKWAGFSDIDRWTIDYAAAKNMTLQEAAIKQHRSKLDFSDLKRAIIQLSAKIPPEKKEIKVLYSDIEDAAATGARIWNATAGAPNRGISKAEALASIKQDLLDNYNIEIKGAQNTIRSDINKKKGSGRGIILKRLEAE